MKAFIFFLIFIQVLQVFEVNSATLGQACTIDRKDGTCMLLKNCPEVKTAYERHNKRPQTCNRQEKTICCPSQNEFVERPVLNTISAQSDNL